MDTATDGVIHDPQRSLAGIRLHAQAIPVKRDPEPELLERIGELETMLRGRDEFLAVLAHELRNPLAPIQNVAEIVRALGNSDERLVKASEVLKKLHAGDYNRGEPGGRDKRVWSETGCTCVLVTSTKDALG